MANRPLSQWTALLGAGAMLISGISHASQPVQAPVAEQIPYTVKSANGDRVDPYYWMRDDKRQDPKVLAHLQAGKQVSRLAIDQGFVRVVSDKVSVVTEAAIDETKIDLKAVETAEASLALLRPAPTPAPAAEPVPARRAFFTGRRAAPGPAFAVRRTPRAAIAIAVIYYLKYSPSKINWPAMRYSDERYAAERLSITPISSPMKVISSGSNRRTNHSIQRLISSS